ncbi:zinc-binding dehydrogenase [Fodinicola acaciae]|uniref:zinc-binding dehydrogenase n=1 Tax=Fodinicola acaciae TaxID=2681555 RepID=UPI001C9E6D45
MGDIPDGRICGLSHRHAGPSEARRGRKASPHHRRGFPLAQAADAHRLGETNRTAGKIVLDTLR